ncbi:unnamed protein product [Merluccius merluccius]
MMNIRNLEDAMILQQRADVAGAIRLLCVGVGALRRQTSLTECQNSVLSRLDHHLRNHLLIVNQLVIQKESPAVTTSQPTTGPQAECPSQPSLSFREVLQRYQALLRGKLDRLATTLQNTTCLHW